MDRAATTLLGWPMRWVYVVGVAAVAATIASDIWFTIDYELAANVSLVYIAILGGAFAVLYAARSKWWTNRIGKVYLAASVILALVLAQASLSVWWHDDYTGRQMIRFVIYSLGALAYMPMIFTLWREQQRDRRNRRSRVEGRDSDG